MKVAILGSGNGACAMAFEWARAGHDIYMFDFPQFDKQIKAINAAGGIYSEGEMEGFQKITYAGHDMETVLKDTKLIFAVGPAYATEPFGKACAPYAKAGQIYVVCPSSCMGAVIFKNALGLKIDDYSITVSDTSTLPYAVRIIADGKIAVYNRLKAAYMLATMTCSSLSTTAWKRPRTSSRPACRTPTPFCIPVSPHCLPPGSKAPMISSSMKRA